LPRAKRAAQHADVKFAIPDLLATAAMKTTMIAALAVGAAVVFTATAHADSGDGKYLGDLDARGVPTGITNGAAPGLGHAICNELDGGTTAPSVLMEVANLQLNDKDEFTLIQAEEIVYWAVTDLCPSHSSGLQPYWRDGGAPGNG